MAKELIILALALLIPAPALAGTFGESRDVDWRLVFHMDEDKGTHLFDDSPVTITSATAFNSAVWVRRPDGSDIGLDFTGTAGPYLDVTNKTEQPQGAQARTLLYLLYTSTPNGINDRILVRMGGAGDRGLWETRVLNNTDRHLTIANANDDDDYGIVVPTNTLICIAETYAGVGSTVINAYLTDGRNMQTGTATKAADLNTGITSRFTIGGSELAAVLRSNMQFFDFAIAFQALTRGQIERECNAALSHRSGR